MQKSNCNSNSNTLLPITIGIAQGDCQTKRSPRLPVGQGSLYSPTKRGYFNLGV